MSVHRPIPPTQFAPHDEKVMSLDPSIFLGFVGIVRVVLMIGNTEKLLRTEGKMPQTVTFLTLFAGYSRDREGHELQKSMVTLTGRINSLTRILVVLTIVFAVINVLLYLGLDELMERLYEVWGPK